MKINPSEHQLKQGTAGSCICGKTWEVQIDINGIRIKMEAHSSAQSLRSIADRADYILTIGNSSTPLPDNVPLILEDGDAFYSVPAATY